MAPNSSLFNDGPAETKPASAPTDTPLTSPVSTVTTSSATVTTTPECTSKKVAPKMEAAIEGDLSGSTDTSEVGSRLRFSRVSPAGLDESKKPITPGPKSILKPSSSFPTFNDSPYKPSNVLLAEVEGEKEPEPEVPAQKNRRRCWECKAKVGLTAVTCRCDYTFCNKHRYAEEHNCRFNFKVAAKRKLENENPRVVPSKVARIN